MLSMCKNRSDIVDGMQKRNGISLFFNAKFWNFKKHKFIGNFRNNIERYIAKIGDYSEKDSGWAFEKVINLVINIIKYNPFCGSGGNVAKKRKLCTYTELPLSLRKLGESRILILFFNLNYFLTFFISIRYWIVIEKLAFIINKFILFHSWYSNNIKLFRS